MSVNIAVSTATTGAAVSVSEPTSGIALTVTGAGISSGTFDHQLLLYRDAANQHPIGAITNLPDKLPDRLTNMDILDILNA